MERKWRAALAMVGAGAAVIAAAVTIAQAPVTVAQDGGVCARLNGAPFYIPPGGYMPKPGEVITGPVTAGPCQESSTPSTPSRPDLPNVPTSTTTSPSTTPPQSPNP